MNSGAVRISGAAAIPDRAMDERLKSVEPMRTTLQDVRSAA